VYKLENACVLREGRKIWALAKTGQSTTLKGRDRVDGYLLLATACDGTLATTAQFTSVRVVCNNTLAIALGSSTDAIKVPHRSQFDAALVKRQLGITVSSWDGFVARMKALVDRPVDPDSVDGLLRRVLTYPAQNGTSHVVNEQAMKIVRSLYDGGGRGAGVASSRGTAWGLLNSVTEYVDHHRRARTDDHRRDAAWFGQGAQIKHKAWDEMIKLVA
jgi:phage/plasmid-like protein (TIGR03299 family)